MSNHTIIASGKLNSRLNMPNITFNIKHTNVKLIIHVHPIIIANLIRACLIRRRLSSSILITPYYLIER